MMNFRSDNTAPAAPEMLAALGRANEGAAAAYGEDAWSRQLDAAFGALFGCEVRVFTVATGTAANAIALAALTPPWGAVVCHGEAHIACDEGGAPEFYTNGAKLTLVEGAAAKVSPQAIAGAVARHGRGIHSVLPSALSISQTSERGAVYTPGEVAALGAAARDAGLGFHMDGARFANAIAALGCAPSDVTWRGGVDVLSFGATKNGALAAEAIVAFDVERGEQIARRRKRGGHLLCKGRYAAAQLLAYVEDGFWLKQAARANALARALGATAGPLLSAPVESNQVFIKPGQAALAALRAAGAEFYDWGPEGSGEARLVVSWNQAESDIEAMGALLSSL